MDFHDTHPDHEAYNREFVSGQAPGSPKVCADALVYMTTNYGGMD